MTDKNLEQELNDSEKWLVNGLKNVREAEKLAKLQEDRRQREEYRPSYTPQPTYSSYNRKSEPQRIHDIRILKPLAFGIALFFAGYFGYDIIADKFFQNNVNIVQTEQTYTSNSKEDGNNSINYHSSGSNAGVEVNGGRIEVSGGNRVVYTNNYSDDDRNFQTRTIVSGDFNYGNINLDNSGNIEISSHNNKANINTLEDLESDNNNPKWQGLKIGHMYKVNDSIYYCDSPAGNRRGDAFIFMIGNKDGREIYKAMSIKRLFKLYERGKVKDLGNWK